MKKIDLLPEKEDNPRNSEGSMIELKSGKIMFIYSHFYGGKGDNAPAFLAARYSDDKGETWTKEDEVIVENEGKENVMSVSLLRLKNGEIILGYIVKNSLQDCKYYVRKSKDEGKAWSEKVLVTNREFDEGNYFVVNNDRIVQLSSGRILVPASHHPCPKDGRILMWMRTNLGSQFFSYSEDGGETWSEVKPSNLVSPCSPASIKRIPETGDLFVVYNDRSGRFPISPHQNRTPLVCAISKDEGKSWEKHFPIENDPEGRFCYTSILFIDGKIILSYSAASSN